VLVALADLKVGVYDSYPNSPCPWEPLNPVPLNGCTPEHRPNSVFLLLFFFPLCVRTLYSRGSEGELYGHENRNVLCRCNSCKRRDFVDGLLQRPANRVTVRPARREAKGTRPPRGVAVGAEGAGRRSALTATVAGARRAGPGAGGSPGAAPPEARRPVPLAAQPDGQGRPRPTAAPRWKCEKRPLKTKVILPLFSPKYF